MYRYLGFILLSLWLSSMSIGGKPVLAQLTDSGTLYLGNPSNYRDLLAQMGPGDTLELEAGTYTQGLSTLCQPPFVNFFTPSERPAHDESGSHHSKSDYAASPSGYAATGPQYFSMPGHGVVPSLAMPHTRG